MMQTIWQFRIGGWTIPIYGFGLMLVIGFLSASHVAKYLAKRHNLDGEVLVNAAMLGLVAGIVGARLSHIFENLGEFTRSDISNWDNLVNMVNLTSGGLTYYGGFILATPVVVGYLLWKRFPLRLTADICAPGLMIALGIGRIGCFLNGCCYGAETDLPWGVRYPYFSTPYVDEYANHQIKPDGRLIEVRPSGRPWLRDPKTFGENGELKGLAAAEHSRKLHPAQLYSTVTALLIAGIALAYLTLPHAAGRGFALMMVLEGGTRFLLELLRQEPAVVGSMSLSMVIGVMVFMGGVVLWVLFGKLARAWGELGVEVEACSAGVGR